MRTFACVVTLQWQCLSGGLRAGTWTGALKMPEGSSRHAATARLLHHAKEELGISGDGAVNVLFLSLEPDEL